MNSQATFNPRVVIGMILAGIIAFGALLLLLAYGGRMGMEPEGRAHVQSVAATGFQGLVTLVGEFHEARIINSPEDQYTEDLLVVALQPHSRPEQVSQLLERRQGRATLLILPKWLTVRDPRRRGWVRTISPGAGDSAAALFGRKLVVQVRSKPAPRFATGDDILVGLRLPVPSDPQTITGGDLVNLVELPGSGALVARLGDQPHYVVADPDLLNNHGLADPVRARAALDLIDGLNATGAQTVNFDTSSDYAGGKEGPNILRLAFEPPFLAMTIALAFAALLAGLHGAFRFGPTRRPDRAIAFGKGALVENGAGLIRLAAREARLGGAYADVVRQDVARMTGAASFLTSSELDSYLDRFAPSGRPSFSQLAAQLSDARDRSALVSAARALFQWKKEIIR